MIKKLAALANKLDSIGLFDYADQIDILICKYAIEEDKEMKPTKHIAMSEFARGRHTKEGKFSYFDGSENELISLVESNFNNARPGYRDGVVKIPVPPDRFFSSTIKMTEGMEFSGVYAPRRPGEKPYMQWTTKNPAGKMPAKTVEIILYRHDVLMEGNEASANSEWEIISINASPLEFKENESEPMRPETLMRNYFKEEGGTEMKGVTPEQFVEMLRYSREYWRDKTTID